MARGKTVKRRRDIQGDAIYNNVLVSKFINRLMRDGKKTTAQRVVYSAFDIIREKGQDPIKVFETAIDTIGPRQEVRARRIGGAAYQVPSEVRGPRRIALAILWILKATEKRPTAEHKTFSEKLAAELIDAAQNQGEAIKKRDVSHKMAEANKAFAHFRW